VEAFTSLVETELGLPAGSVRPEARLIEDLGLDSLQMLDLLLLLDALDAHLDVEDLSRVVRVADLHRKFVERWTLARRASQVCESVSESWPRDDVRRTRCRSTASQMSGLRTMQRPIRSSDYEFLYELVHPIHAGFTRRGAQGPNPEEFASELWRDVLAQHVVLDRSTGAPIGMVSAREADMRRGIAFLDFILDPRVHGLGWPFEAAMLFVAHLFRTWPLRKIYVEVLAHHVDDIASGLGRLFVEEGRLVAHEYVDGAWVDLHILGLFRERWERDAPRILRGLVGRQQSAADVSRDADDAIARTANEGRA
jgi:RimJ/RimL family protein N-acetyltransferase